MGLCWLCGVVVRAGLRCWVVGLSGAVDSRQYRRQERARKQPPLMFADDGHLSEHVSRQVLLSGSTLWATGRGAELRGGGALDPGSVDGGSKCLFGINSVLK